MRDVEEVFVIGKALVLEWSAGLFVGAIFGLIWLLGFLAMVRPSLQPALGHQTALGPVLGNMVISFFSAAGMTFFTTLGLIVGRVATAIDEAERKKAKPVEKISIRHYFALLVWTVVIWVPVNQIFFLALEWLKLYMFIIIDPVIGFGILLAVDHYLKKWAEAERAHHRRMEEYRPPTIPRR